MAIAMTFRGFNDLGCSVTLIFLSMGHFLYRFSTFCKKNELQKTYIVQTLQGIPFI